LNRFLRKPIQVEFWSPARSGKLWKDDWNGTSLWPFSALQQKKGVLSSGWESMACLEERRIIVPPRGWVGLREPGSHIFQPRDSWKACYPGFESRPRRVNLGWRSRFPSPGPAEVGLVSVAGRAGRRKARRQTSVSNSTDVRNPFFRFSRPVSA
jgi:hypothetical protein